MYENNAKIRKNYIEEEYSNLYGYKWKKSRIRYTNTRIIRIRLQNNNISSYP